MAKMKESIFYSLSNHLNRYVRYQPLYKADCNVDISHLKFINWLSNMPSSRWPQKFTEKNKMPLFNMLK